MTDEKKTPLVEFGGWVMVTKGIEDLSDVNTLLDADIKKSEDLLGYLKDVVYTEPFKKVQNDTPVDKLNRFNCHGWRGSFASPGYTAFQEHFKCRDEHTPYYPSLKFIWRQIIKYFKYTRSRDK